jgi:release factor glutamine methyltransferase
MSIQKLLKKATAISILDAEILLAFAIKKNREYIKAHPEKNVSFFHTLLFFYFLQKRKNNTPIAYITKQKEFYGLDFQVTKDTLVPRPETEIMVELINNILKKTKTNTILIDIGTGSGCIPISMAKIQKNITIFATDISKKALYIAKRNAQKHKVDLTFHHGNLLTPLLKNKNIWNTKNNIIITANLPYITEKQFQDEPSIQKEPKQALVADDNGLALYKELLNQIKTLNNKDILLFIEIDPMQTKLITTFIQNNFPKANIHIHKDLCGRDRIVEINVIN